MKFLTDNIRVEQTEQAGIWRTLDNILFQDSDGTIYLAPRYILTDGYTIPNWLASLGGDNMEWDIRCCTFHDMECKYAQKIRVALSEHSLKTLGFLIYQQNDQGNWVWSCRDIPKQVLQLENTSFSETNNRFYRMMLCAKNITRWRAKLMRFAVNFNFGWHSHKKSLNFDDVFVNNL